MKRAIKGATRVFTMSGQHEPNCFVHNAKNTEQSLLKHMARGKPRRATVEVDGFHQVSARKIPNQVRQDAGSDRPKRI